MPGYKSVWFHGEWQAETLGCGHDEYSETESLHTVDAAIAEMGLIAANYRRTAERYDNLIRLAKLYDIGQSWARWSRYKNALSDGETVARVLDGEDCGTYGRDLAEKYTVYQLIHHVTEALEALWYEDKEIAEAFGW